MLGEVPKLNFFSPTIEQESGGFFTSPIPTPLEPKQISSSSGGDRKADRSTSEEMTLSMSQSSSGSTTSPSLTIQSQVNISNSMHSKPSLLQEQISVVSPDQIEGECIKEGSKVKANWKGKGLMYPWKITRDHGDGTFDILYDDGDSEVRVKEDRIRAVTIELLVDKCWQQKTREDKVAKADM